MSSVSGGSITAGVLGFKWSRLGFGATGIAGNFDAEVVQPIRALASRTIDEGAIVAGILTPGSISDKVTDASRSSCRLAAENSFRAERTKVELAQLEEVRAALIGDIEAMQVESGKIKVQLDATMGQLAEARKTLEVAAASASTAEGRQALTEAQRSVATLEKATSDNQQAQAQAQRLGTIKSRVVSPSVPKMLQK